MATGFASGTAYAPNEPKLPVHSPVFLSNMKDDVERASRISTRLLGHTNSRESATRLPTFSDDSNGPVAFWSHGLSLAAKARMSSRLMSSGYDCSPSERSKPGGVQTTVYPSLASLGAHKEPLTSSPGIGSAFAHCPPIPIAPSVV